MLSFAKHDFPFILICKKMLKYVFVRIKPVFDMPTFLELGTLLILSGTDLVAVKNRLHI